MNYYLIYTRSAQEQIAAEQLRRQSIEVVAPQYQVRKPDGRGKRKLVDKPLFPRYIFARFELEQRFRSVRGTRGVKRLVSFADEPLVVPIEMIQEIQERIVDGYVVMDGQKFDPRCPYLKDEKVIVTFGALYGVEGLFKEWLPDGQRVSILFDFLGRQHTKTFAVEHIRPAFA